MAYHKSGFTVFINLFQDLTDRNQGVVLLVPYFYSYQGLWKNFLLAL